MGGRDVAVGAVGFGDGERKGARARTASGRAARVKLANPTLLRRWRRPGLFDYLSAWWEGYDTASLIREAKAPTTPSRAGRGRSEEGAEAGTENGIDRAKTGWRDASDRREGSPRDGGRGGNPTIAPTSPRGSARPLFLTTLKIDRGSPTAVDDDPPDLGRDARPIWTLERACAAEMLWGADAIGPFGPSSMVEAVRPFGLGPDRKALDLTAGLGGVARAIAGGLNTQVMGLEMSPLLARMAMGRSHDGGMGGRAPVTRYDPNRFEAIGRFDLVYGDRLFHRVADKDRFLDSLSESVAPGGGLLLFDYVADGHPESLDAWNDWRASEPREVAPWSVDHISDALTGRRFRVGPGEDLTDRYRRRILTRIHHLASVLNEVPIREGVLGAIGRELAIWRARLRILGRGLRFHRMVAMKAA